MTSFNFKTYCCSRCGGDRQRRGWRRVLRLDAVQQFGLGAAGEGADQELTLLRNKVSDEEVAQFAEHAETYKQLALGHLRG